MLCKYYLIVLYTVHVTAFCLGGPFFPDTVYVDCGIPTSFVFTITGESCFYQYYYSLTLLTVSIKLSSYED